jgi:hypothetical protein
LSRSFEPAEKNYWPTELEIAGIVITIKKKSEQYSSHSKSVQKKED